MTTIHARQIQFAKMHIRKMFSTKFGKDTQISNFVKNPSSGSTAVP
jgi:hypothetical protein